MVDIAKNSGTGLPAESLKTADVGSRAESVAPLLSDGITTLIYDGECPVCGAYVRFIRLRESVGQVQLIDARKGGDVVSQVVAEGMDLNEGMVLWYGNQFYYGADCVHMLAILSTRSGFFNRANAKIFGYPALAKYLYPVLRFGRNILLKILGRSPLELR